MLIKNSDAQIQKIIQDEKDKIFAETANRLAETANRLAETANRLVKKDKRLAETAKRLVEKDKRLAEEKKLIKTNLQNYPHPLNIDISFKYNNKPIKATSKSVQNSIELFKQNSPAEVLIISQGYYSIKTGINIALMSPGFSVCTGLVLFIPSLNLVSIAHFDCYKNHSVSESIDLLTASILKDYSFDFLNPMEYFFCICGSIQASLIHVIAYQLSLKKLKFTIIQLDSDGMLMLYINSFNGMITIITNPDTFKIFLSQTQPGKNQNERFELGSKVIVKATHEDSIKS